MRALVERGHEVYAVCPKGEVFDQFARYSITAVAYDIVRASLNPLREFVVFVRISSILRSIKPDILHTFTAKPNVYGTLAGKFAGVPVIYNLVEGLGSFYIDNSVTNRMVRTLIEILYRITCRLSTKTVFVNQDDPAYFRQTGLIPAEKIHLIRSVGIDTSIFRPDRYDCTTLRQSLGLGPGSRVVLMVARAIWHKGLAEYVEAARLVRLHRPQTVFLLAGNVDEGNPSSASRDYLRAQHDIVWLGHRSDVAELTALCDVYVLPSYREGVPRTLLEAAAMGKPIVTTDTVGCREVVEDGVNGILVPVRDSIGLAGAIERLLADDRLRVELGAQGRVKAIREFDVRQVVQQYLELYGCAREPV